MAATALFDLKVEFGSLLKSSCLVGQDTLATHSHDRICGYYRANVNSMGLDAVVYKNVENLPESLRSLVKVVDALTGELEFVTPQPPSPNYKDSLLAADIRIGNISRVKWLREQIESRWPGKCFVILNAVLCNGTHSGDFIPLDEVHRIKLEIDEIDCDAIPAELAAFFEQIGKLSDAAERERNPVVFQ